jgi:hypothetical protein
LTINEDQEAAERIAHRFEQQKEDQYDLRVFYEMKQEESHVKKARRSYSRLIKNFALLAL